jgi:hypothetical protein
MNLFWDLGIELAEPAKRLRDCVTPIPVQLLAGTLKLMGQICD